MLQTTAVTHTIGEVIRAWRVFRGLRLIDLAEKAGVPKGYVSALEHDRKTHPWRENLKKLAAALGISLQDIDDLRMPPAKAAGKAHQTAGQGTHAVSPPHPSTAQAPQPPAVPAAEGAVLQQLLEQMQALTAAVSHLQADVAELKQRVVIRVHPD
jgi:transcriptional regulator with XRE-family HTH domain